MEFYILQIIFGVLWGLICKAMAENRGRRGDLGFVAGLLFGLFAVIYYWIAGDTREEKVRKRVEDEKLAKELGKN